MPASFQEILDKALADYREQIGVEINDHPFLDELRGRNSPDGVLKLLEEKANAFKVYRDGNHKLINWLSPVVQAIHLLSGVLGEAVSSNNGISYFFILYESPFDYQVPFQPAKAIFVGVDVLITVRIPCCQHLTYIHLCTPGSRRRQLKLRCTCRIVRMYRKLPQTPSDLYRYPADNFDDAYNRQDHGRVTLCICPRYQTNQTRQIQ